MKFESKTLYNLHHSALYVGNKREKVKLQINKV